MPLPAPRTLAFALLAASLAAAPARAQDTTGDTDDMAVDDTVARPAIVQTVPPVLADGLIVTPSEGGSYTASFAEDGTFRTAGGEAGGWTFQNGFLCLSAETGKVGCTLVDPTAGPGDQWTTTNANGELTRYALPALEDPDGEGGAG